MDYSVSRSHCTDNNKDRTVGAYWEKQFCVMAAGYGYVFTPLQLGRSKSAQYYANTSGKWNHYTLPDVTIWTHPGQHHEIKHKDPTRAGMYGLEQYRLEALLRFADTTGQQVLYTIHNHALNGGRENQTNDIAHWFTADVTELNGHWDLYDKNGISWVNGVKRTGIPIYYWNTDKWGSLQHYWTVEEFIDEIPF